VLGFPFVPYVNLSLSLGQVRLGSISAAMR
jgi:hypothetical protein